MTSEGLSSDGIIALLSFILWFSSTILMPKRLEKVEETLSILNSRQSKMEVKTELIYQDMQSIKNNIYMNRSK